MINVNSVLKDFSLLSFLTLEAFSVQAQESDASDTEKAGQQEEMDRCVAVQEEQAPSTQDNEALAAFPQSSSQKTNPQSSPATVKAVPSTPTFSFK